jgi:hypothetical protein
MVTEKDHIRALEAMMDNIIRDAEAKVAEMKEAKAALSRAPQLIDEFRAILGKSPLAASVSKPSVTVTEAPVYNRKQPELLQEYLESFPTNESIRVPAIIKFFRDHGVEGKDKSLYTYIYSLLNNLVKDKTLQKEKGFGYFKPDRFHPLAEE